MRRFLPVSAKSQPALDDVPMEPASSRRARTRRGGPRTPLPLVGIIAIAAGIGIAYVNQTARATQATYRANALAAEQRTLQAEDSRVGDELNRLRASERVVAAAQQLGMRPAGQWAYVASAPVPVIPSPSAPALAANNPGQSDPFAHLVASLGGAIGIRDVEAAAP